jgi:hypothetical protein
MCTEAVPDLRIPGGGPAAKDCAWQWSMLIDPSKVVVTRDGRPSTKQSCTDNDPTCDLDATAGRCRLRLWGCVGEPNTALGCGAAMVTSAGVRIPRATTKRLHEQQGRAALLQAIAALGLPKGPSTIGQTCRSFEVDVPATRRALTFKVQSTFGADSDIDKLKLRCVTP